MMVAFIENTPFELLGPDAKSLVLSGLAHDRAQAASAGYAMDILAHDEDPFVRYCVARNEFAIDTLANDSDWHVREIINFKAHCRGFYEVEKYVVAHPERYAPEFDLGRISHLEQTQPIIINLNERASFNPSHHRSNEMSAPAEPPKRERFRDVASLAAFGQAKADAYNREHAKTTEHEQPTRMAR